MDTKLMKIESFVGSLETSLLSENQQITLIVNPEDEMGGTSTNKSGCSNGSSCQGSINYKNCVNSNGSCVSSINEKKCTNTAVAAVAI